MRTKLVTLAEDMLRTARELERALDDQLNAGNSEEKQLTDDEWRALSLALFVRKLFEAPEKHTGPAAVIAAGPRVVPKGHWVGCSCRSAGECPHGTPYWQEDYPGAEKRALSKLVSDFHLQMRAKLHAKAGEKAGWADNTFTVEKIKEALIEHVLKGDPVDVANFAAFWWNRLRARKDADE